MVRLLPASLLLPLAGCEGLLPYLEEQREAPEVVYWTGTVLDGPYAEDAGVFTGGAIAASTLDGAALTDADGEPLETPYELEGEPGAWVLTVPVATEILLRLSGEGFASTVWSAVTPSGRGYWYTGALFARRAEDVDATFAALEEAGLIDVLPADLADGERVHFWAEPTSPEDWVGASMAILDAEGRAELVALTVDEDGTARLAEAEDPIHYVFAFDLAPGLVTFEAATPAGRHVLLSWPAAGGDLLNASFLSLSES